MKKLILFSLISALFTVFICSCDDSKTYAELLTEENHYINNYLADQRVINGIPEDTVFLTGADAPYYRLDEDGNLYMQVVDAGTPGNMAKENELIYMRFTRYNLALYRNGELGDGEGNDNVLGGNYSFRFGNYELNSSYSMGSGVQAPLIYLPVDAVVNIVIKSQFGLPAEMANVIPYLYKIRYYRPKI